MFKSVDRIQVAVRDLAQATDNYAAVLGCTVARERESAYLNASVRVLSLGDSEVELCAPIGPGPVASHLDEMGEGMYRGGVTVDDVGACKEALDRRGIGAIEENDQLFVDRAGMFGLSLVVSAFDSFSQSSVAGPVDFLYEITQVLETDWPIVARHYEDALGLDSKNFVGIEFPRFGYEGVLMKFDLEHLDRIELSEAHDPAFAMGRFSRKRGDALYMCYVETGDLPAIIANLERRGQKWTRRTDEPGQERDGLWIHPGALNGVLIGVSRRSLAWGWSGRPDLVQPRP